MPSVNEFIERARDRRTDFIESIYPVMELHVHNSGNNKHMETLESIGIHKGPALLAIVNSALKLAQTQLDVYGYHVGSYNWAPFTPASNLSISGSTLTVAAHKCVFAGKEFTVKASTINLQTLSSSWNSIMWNLSLRYYPGRGYAVIEPTVTFVPETTHIVHIGTWQSSEGFKVNRHVRMFNFKMDVEDDTSSPPPGGGGDSGCYIQTELKPSNGGNSNYEKIGFALELAEATSSYPHFPWVSNGYEIAGNGIMLFGYSRDDESPNTGRVVSAIPSFVKNLVIYLDGCSHSLVYAMECDPSISGGCMVTLQVGDLPSGSGEIRLYNSGWSLEQRTMNIYPDSGWGSNQEWSKLPVCVSLDGFYSLA